MLLTFTFPTFPVILPDTLLYTKFPISGVGDIEYCIGLMLLLVAVTGTNELPEKVSPTYRILEAKDLTAVSGIGSTTIKSNVFVTLIGISSVKVTVYDC